MWATATTKHTVIPHRMWYHTLCEAMMCHKYLKKECGKGGAGEHVAKLCTIPNTFWAHLESAVSAQSSLPDV